MGSKVKAMASTADHQNTWLRCFGPLGHGVQFQFPTVLTRKSCDFGIQAVASTADSGHHAAGKTEVSRAFGDAALKSKGLSAVADVQIFNLTKHDKFLLLGCDGFWSCWSADDAVTTTQGLLEAGRTPKEAANRIVYLVSLIRHTCLSANILRILALPKRPDSAVPDVATVSRLPLLQHSQPTDCQHSTEV